MKTGSRKFNYYIVEKLFIESVPLYSIPADIINYFGDSGQNLINEFGGYKTNFFARRLVDSWRTQWAEQNPKLIKYIQKIERLHDIWNHTTSYRHLSEQQKDFIIHLETSVGKYAYVIYQHLLEKRNYFTAKKMNMLLNENQLYVFPELTDFLSLKRLSEQEVSFGPERRN